MHIRARLNNGQALNTGDHTGAALFSGTELVKHKLEENEGDVAKFEVLVGIVGRLVEHMPTNYWFDIVEPHTLDEVRR